MTLTLHYVFIMVTQEPIARADPDERDPSLSLLKEQYANRAKASLERVLSHSDEIMLEHYIIYHTRTFVWGHASYATSADIHYLSDHEIGRLYACMGNSDKARVQYPTLLSSETQHFTGFEQSKRQN